MMHGQRNIKFILRIKEQETRLTLQEHDDDDETPSIQIILRPILILASIHTQSFQADTSVKFPNQNFV